MKKSVLTGKFTCFPKGARKVIEIQMTYDIVTPESAANGDFEDHGFAEPRGRLYSTADKHFDNLVCYIGYEEALKQMTPEPERFSDLDEAVNFLSNYEPLEPSSSHFHEGVWYTQVESEDFRTGKSMTFSFHIKASQEIQHRIWLALVGSE
jgi:hypothetical protein